MRRLVLLFKMVVLLQKFGYAYIADDITGRTMEEWVKGKGKRENVSYTGSFFAEEASTFCCYDAFAPCFLLCSTWT